MDIVAEKMPVSDGIGQIGVFVEREGWAMRQIVKARLEEAKSE